MGSAFGGSFWSEAPISRDNIGWTSACRAKGPGPPRPPFAERARKLQHAAFGRGRHANRIRGGRSIGLHPRCPAARSRRGRPGRLYRLRARKLSARSNIRACGDHRNIAATITPGAPALTPRRNHPSRCVDNLRAGWGLARHPRCSRRSARREVLRRAPRNLSRASFVSPCAPETAATARSGAAPRTAAALWHPGNVRL